MQLALFGTGVLGSAIAERLHRTGHLVTVYNRTIEKALPLRNRGLRVVSRSADAMGSAEAVLLLLADETAIRSVLLQGETAQRLAGRTIIQMGTIGPDQSLELAFEIQRLGGAYMEAPVLGSVTEAAQGTLLVMVGSTPEQFTQWSPMLQALGQEVQRIGPVGSAAVIKLALNQLIAAETAAFGLSLGLVRRNGLSTDTFMALLRKSALFAPTFDKKLPRLTTREYQRPNFSTRHLLKDVDLMLETSQRAGLSTLGLQGVRSLLERALEMGFSDGDYSALYEAIDGAGNGRA
ncbi:MAG: NAD(P)-dependent oxidoreductase [Nitrospiraceae bacterium]|nr:NAD(P)-dependent oxidoreductase [Nitrospiraceae bacterium]